MSHDPQGFAARRRQAAGAAFIVHGIDPLAQISRASTWPDIYRSSLSNLQCLLVFDNLSSVDVIRELRTPSSAQIIATARHRFAIPGGTLLGIEEMSPDDGLALLKAILWNLDFTDNQLLELAGACSSLPIALRAAATYILVHKTPLNEYLARLKDARLRRQGLTYISQAKLMDWSSPHFD